MAKRRKPRKCRICKKRPVWIGGDVRNPGPVCKKCYHKHVWINRPQNREISDRSSAEAAETEARWIENDEEFF